MNDTTGTVAIVGLIALALAITATAFVIFHERPPAPAGVAQGQRLLDISRDSTGAISGIEESFA